MRSRYCSATSRASHLPARTAVRDRHRGRAARVDHCPPPGAAARARGRFVEPGRSCRPAAGRSRARRRPAATASPRRRRVGQSNGTACVIGSTDAVSSARRASTYSRMARQIVGHRAPSPLREPQPREQRELADFVGGDARHESRIFIPRLSLPTRGGAQFGARPEFATGRATRYSVGSDMTPSGNRFRALVVYLAPAASVRWRSAATAAGGCRTRRRSPRAYSAELSVRFEVSPDRPDDGLGARVPRRRRRSRDRRARSGRSAGRGRAQSRVRACATSTSRTARWSRAAARSISRSSAASASAWAHRARRRP